jgi:methionyl aminopeptidase
MASLVREELRAMVRPGLETRELDEYVEKRLAALGAKPAFKGYRGYPASVCVSVNEEVVHGIPGNRRLREGDLVSVDVGVEHGGFFADTAFSTGAGETDGVSKRLMDVTRSALWEGIGRARAGNRVSDISNAIQRFVEGAGFSVVREFVGHGIGRKMHEEPQIPNYGSPGQGLVLRAGQMLAIEPMVNEGGAAVRVMENGWTAVAVDGKRSAHFEHTVLVTGGEPEVLTEAEGEARA